MGDEQRNALLGRVRTIESPEGVCAIAVRGFLSIAVINEVVSQIDRLASAEPSIRAVVIDVLGIDGFEPGVPAKVIQWLGARAQQIQYAALVTTSPVLTATVRAGELLLPATSFVASNVRSEALCRAGQAVRSQGRVVINARRQVAAVTRKQTA